MNLIDIMTENALAVTLIIVSMIILAIVVLMITGRKKQARMLVYRLVLEAERAFIDESGRGHDKYNLVLRQVYQAFPPIVKLILTREQLDHWIEEACEKLKDLTDNGAMDNHEEGYNEEI